MSSSPQPFRWPFSGQSRIGSRAGPTGLMCLAVVLISVHSDLHGAGSPTSNRAGQVDDLEVVLSELRASNREWQRNDREYRELRESGGMSDSEGNEFAAFVARLRHQVLADCTRFQALGGDPARHAIDCGELPKETQGASGIPTLPNLAPASTVEEEIAALDARLQEMEQGLNAQLIGRQTKLREIEQARARARPAASGRRDGTGRGKDAQASDAAASSDDRAASDGSQSGDATRAGNGDRVARSTAAEQGAGIGAAKQGANRPMRRGGESDGSDDDALARQLREAAVKETDPVLKEKLWNEYRKYKESIR